MVQLQLDELDKDKALNYSTVFYDNTAPCVSTPLKTILHTVCHVMRHNYGTIASIEACLGAHGDLVPEVLPSQVGGCCCPVCVLPVCVLPVCVLLGRPALCCLSACVCLPTPSTGYALMQKRVITMDVYKIGGQAWEKAEEELEGGVTAKTANFVRSVLGLSVIPPVPGKQWGELCLLVANQVGGHSGCGASGGGASGGGGRGCNCRLQLPAATAGCNCRLQLPADS